MNTNFDVAVVGLGVMGSSVLAALSKRMVTIGIDEGDGRAWLPASFADTRVSRSRDVKGNRSFELQFCNDSWLELSSEARVPVCYGNGALTLFDGEASAQRYCDSLGVHAPDLLYGEELASVAGVKVRAVCGLSDPGALTIMAERSVTELRNRARLNGAEIVEECVDLGEILALWTRSREIQLRGHAIRARYLVIATGARMPRGSSVRIVNQPAPSFWFQSDDPSWDVQTSPYLEANVGFRDSLLIVPPVDGQFKIRRFLPPTVLGSAFAVLGERGASLVPRMMLDGVSRIPRRGWPLLSMRQMRRSQDEARSDVRATLGAGFRLAAHDQSFYSYIYGRRNHRFFHFEDAVLTVTPPLGTGFKFAPAVAAQVNTTLIGA